MRSNLPAFYNKMAMVNLKEMQGAVSWNKFFGDWNYSVNANYSNSSSNGEENRENKTQNEASGSLQEIIAIPTKWKRK